MTHEPASRNLLHRLRRLKRKYNISEDQFYTKIAEHRAQLKALTSELKNRVKKFECKRINKKFKENPRKVYRELKEEDIEVDKPPDKDQLDEFWRPFFETPKEHKENIWVNEIIYQFNSIQFNKLYFQRVTFWHFCHFYNGPLPKSIFCCFGEHCYRPKWPFADPFWDEKER